MGRLEKGKFMIHCVTTMNKSYYDGIGKLMIKTWIDCFPDDYRLHLYLEDFTIIVDDPRVVIEDYTEVQKLWDMWWNKKGSENSRHQKFTIKACTQIAAWEKIKEGQSLWLDADVLFIKKIPDNFFNRILEDYPLASWGEYSFESGTVFANLSHPDWNKIFDIYKEIYVGEQGLLEGERWFDGELLGRAVKDSGVRYRNLWCFCDKKTSTPLNWSWIGEYMRHFKAKGKNRLKDELISEFKRSDLLELLEKSD